MESDEEKPVVVPEEVAAEEAPVENTEELPQAEAEVAAAE
tara:strand:+ start:404 stop:523 length:120 start_codon:yes stop_codon:yes gene_type:complete